MTKWSLNRGGLWIQEQASLSLGNDQGDAVLIVTVSHRTFSGQLRYLSGQFFPLTKLILAAMYVGNAFESMSEHFQWLTMSTGDVEVVCVCVWGGGGGGGGGRQTNLENHGINNICNLCHGFVLTPPCFFHGR